nr:GNAT family N-acetyltransferase [uncultured Pseudomonas sp.]
MKELDGKLVLMTERLLVRRWVPDDLEPLLRIYGDVEAMRWVSDGLALTPQQAANWLEVTANNYRQRGYGMYTMTLHDGGAVIGFCGLVHPDDQDKPEIKYAFAREHWGHGYASEVACALLPYAARQLGLTQIIATVAPDNAASRRVLIKAGMTLTDTLGDDGSQTLLMGWHAPAAELQ